MLALHTASPGWRGCHPLRSPLMVRGAWYRLLRSMIDLDHCAWAGGCGQGIMDVGRFPGHPWRRTRVDSPPAGAWVTALNWCRMCFGHMAHKPLCAFVDLGGFNHETYILVRWHFGSRCWLTPRDRQSSNLARWSFCYPPSSSLMLRRFGRCPLSILAVDTLPIVRRLWAMAYLLYSPPLAPC